MIHSSDYVICKEARGYSVWSLGLSGSKQDCYGSFNSKRSALSVLRQLRKAKEEFERSGIVLSVIAPK